VALSRDYLERLAKERFEPEFRREFLRAIDRLKQDFPFEQIVSLIESGQIEAAVEAVGLNPDAFDNLTAVTASAVAASAQETGRIVPPRDGPDGAKIRFAFRTGNPRAVEAVDNLNTEMMRGLRGGPAITREGANAVREYIREGLRNGENPRKVARRLRGAFNAATQTYEGGILGLTDAQAQHVRNAEAQLRSGDKRQLRKYLGRKLRDRRFDRTILKAINDGTPLSEDTINKAVNGYSRKYIGFRAETVARDQMLSALQEGQEQALNQAIQDGHIREDQVVREWRTAADDRVRNAHRAIPRMNPGGRRKGEKFQTPLGPLRYPRDPQGTRGNTIQCRCTLVPRIVDRDREVG
jgi:hypothetical protein